MSDQRKYSVLCSKKQTALETIREEGIYFSAPCGGQGICGKCRIRLITGSIPVTKSDEEFFTGEELAEGWRLACRAIPETDCEIEFPFHMENDFEAVSFSVYTLSGKNRYQERQDHRHEMSEEYMIAGDIGTTTIALSLIGAKTGEVCGTYTTINRQRQYGADVISRIQACQEGKGKLLQKCIREDLQNGIRELLRAADIGEGKVQAAALAGNTTMGHLLMGFSCDGLGVYPFTCVDIRTITGECGEILGAGVLSCPVTLLPGISAYVGGDIAAGILSCGMAEKEEVLLLIDLGTNGEMAIGSSRRILTTSAAAGPAFEGGNISCGTGSIPGAICHVEINGDSVKTETIGDRPPVGICGTGVIETAAELIKERLVDETGLMDEKYTEGICLGKSAKGDEIRFTQKDVREIQLAKSAIRAGIEVLLLRYGVTYEEVGQVCLAGGFGLKLDPEKAVMIGMLPAEFRGKIHAAGNSSLGGAARYLTDPEAPKVMEKIVSIAEEINLSQDADFSHLYMEYMFF